MKRLWRVTWVDADGYTGVRHYQSQTAAKHRRDVLMQGKEEEPDTFIDRDGEGDGREAVPPARSVRIERSDPITFPVDQS